MNIDEYAKIAVEHQMAVSEHNLKQYLSVLFKGIDFNGKSFLDIGGGTGVFTHYAATSGATRSICMEPEFDGSTSALIYRQSKKRATNRRRKKTPAKWFWRV